MKIGCHAVLFKERIKEDTDTVIGAFKDMGANGFEMGVRFFGVDDKEYLKSKLEQYGIELSALHVGFPLPTWVESAEENTRTLMKAVDFLEDMPNKNILISTNRKDSENEYDMRVAVENLNIAAGKCLEKGVTVHYHNHDWEFENDAKLYNMLVEFAPNLNFAFDLGWVFVGGSDAVKLMDEQKERITYLHLRDPIAVAHRDFADLGEGVFNMEQVIGKAKEILGDNGWFVVEYEKGEVNFERYENAMNFIKKYL